MLTDDETLERASFEVDVILPNTTCQWYDYNSKLLIPAGVTELRFEVGYQMCCGMFVKAGEIVPIKLHQGALSLDRAKDMPLRLEVYVEPRSNKSRGYLYLDDGISFNYTDHNEKTFIRYDFDYKTGNLTSTYDLDASTYNFTTDLMVRDVHIFGVETKPTAVLDGKGAHVKHFSYSAKRS